MFCLWVNLHLGGSVLRLEDPLREDISWPFDLDDAELIRSNSDDALETLRRAEAGGGFKRSIAHWSHCVLVHVAVANIRL